MVGRNPGVHCRHCRESGNPQHLTRVKIGASFAALETGVWLLMVLALYALKSYEAKKRERELEMQAIGAAMWREAQRQSEESGESPEEIFKRLQSTNWRPD